MPRHLSLLPECFPLPSLFRFIFYSVPLLNKENPHAARLLPCSPLGLSFGFYGSFTWGKMPKFLLCACHGPLCSGTEPSGTQLAQLPPLCLAVSAASFHLRLQAVPHMPLSSWPSHLRPFLCAVCSELPKGGYLYPNMSCQNLLHQGCLCLALRKEAGA